MKENYTEEFKREAVRLILTSGKTQRQIAKELGVTEWAILVYPFCKLYGTAMPLSLMHVKILDIVRQGTPKRR